MNAVLKVKGLFAGLSGRIRHAQAGQSHTEYGIILVLIGITVIFSVMLMGNTVHDMFQNVSHAMPR